MMPITPRASILAKANQLIHGERQQDYGDPSVSFAQIAALWSAYKGIPFTATDAGMMLMLLKASRLSHSPNHTDSYVDACGYLALAAECAGVEVK